MATETARLGEIDHGRLIGRARSVDLAFACAGLLVMVIAMAMLMALILDLVVDGLPRLSWDFLTNFPSRRPGRAGILSAWVGTAVLRGDRSSLTVPLGVTTAGVYLEEYARRNWLTDLIEINISNLAGVPSITFGLLELFLVTLPLVRSELARCVRRPGPDTLDPRAADHHRHYARGPADDSRQHIREAAYAARGRPSGKSFAYTACCPIPLGGILTGTIIALSRAIGETAPLIAIGARVSALCPRRTGQRSLTGRFPFVNFGWLHVAVYTPYRC